MHTPDFPDEILLHILASSVAYHSVFNHALYLGPNSPWSRNLRHKKSVLLVNKRWNRLATPLLYCEVTLRRASQLQLLQETLGNPHLGALVKVMTFGEGCGIDYEDNRFPTLRSLGREPGDSQALLKRQEDQELAFIALPNLCSRLERICILGFSNGIRDILRQCNLTRLAEFSLGEFFYPAWIRSRLGGDVLRAAERIRYLAMGDFQEEFREVNDEDTRLEFPALEELRINKTIGWLLKGWSFPKLKRLTLTGKANLFHHRLVEDICIFLEKNGQELEYLAILDTHHSTHPPFQSICDSCPKLEHLVLAQLRFTSGSSQNPFQFLNVQRLDIYSPVFTRIKLQETLRECLPFFPALELVHLIQQPHMIRNIFSSWPIPPNHDFMLAFKDACSWLQPLITDFRECRLSLNGDGQHILVQSLEFLMEENSDEDSDFSPYSSESDSEDDISDVEGDEGQL